MDELYVLRLAISGSETHLRTPSTTGWFTAESELTEPVAVTCFDRHFVITSLTSFYKVLLHGL